VWPSIHRSLSVDIYSMSAINAHQPGISDSKNQKIVIRIYTYKEKHSHSVSEGNTLHYLAGNIKWQQNFDTVGSLTDAPPPPEFSWEKRGQSRKQPKKLCVKLICKCLYRSVGMTDISYCSSCDTARYISHQYWPGSTALARMFTSGCNYYVTCNRVYIFLNYCR